MGELSQRIGAKVSGPAWEPLRNPLQAEGLPRAMWSSARGAILGAPCSPVGRR